MRLVVDLQACQSPGSRVRGIGRYSLSLARAMVRRAGKNEVVIALNGCIPDSIDWMRASFSDVLRLSQVRTWQSIPDIAEAFNGGAARSQAASELFRQAMMAMRPDFLQISSLFEGLDSDVANLVGTVQQGLPTAVTFYDLIPLAQSETYLAQPLVREWYMRKVDQLKRARLLMAISAFAKSEAVDLLGIQADQITNILGACDAVFQPVPMNEDARASLHRRYGVIRPFVMYTGGFDPRKNIGNLIRAYASLPSAIREAHQLLIVGSPPANERAQLEGIRAECGLSTVDCVLTGFVPDEDLAALYSDCRLYAFPSLQEGFGLPALEAMSCGAVVVGANLSSLPEVIGFKDALFDPRNLYDMTAALVRGLGDQNFRSAFLDHSKEQVRRFTWDESARLAWDGLEEAHARRPERPLLLPVLVSTSEKSVLDGKRLVSRLSGGEHHAPSIVHKRGWEDRPSWFLISDAESALQAWDVMSRRCIGLVLADDLDLKALVTNVTKSEKGLEAVKKIVEAQGAYATLLLEDESRDWELSLVVDAWMRRVAVAISQASQWPRLSDDASAIDWPLAACDQGVPQALNRLALLADRPLSGDAVWLAISSALNDNRHVNGSDGARLLIDVSQLVVHDARSGIQRVVRNILRQLLLMNRRDLQIVPIYFDDYCNCRYAHSFAWRFLGLAPTKHADEIVDWLPGDRFLGLDLSAHIVPFHPKQFARLRDMGVRMTFVVYDLLPILRPDCFDPNVLGVFQRWYQTIAEIADNILCISRAVADDFTNWLDQAKPARARPLRVGHFHLGADREQTSRGADIAVADEAGALSVLGQRSTVLMVSTIEPRKGYQQALEAFEILWARGDQLNLAIVGKAGWRTEALIGKMRTHPELGHRLHWFEAVSDDVLHALYQRSDLLLSASEGEGFGLPLIEAAQYGVSLLVRDLAVFREVAGEHASYFSGYAPENLADVVSTWFSERHAGKQLPASIGLPWLTWRESSEQLLNVITDERWDRVVGDTKRYWFPVIDHRMQTQTGYFERGILHASHVAGFLIYGPYADIKRGSYRLRVFGEIPLGDADTWLDVVSGAGDEVFYQGSFAEPERSVPGVILETRLHLNQQVKSLEIRVWSSGKNQLCLVGFELIEETPTMV
jgi:glycosyltransferase involved in cell wall biosynthesis